MNLQGLTIGQRRELLDLVGGNRDNLFLLQEPKFEKDVNRIIGKARVQQNPFVQSGLNGMESAMSMVDDAVTRPALAARRGIVGAYDAMPDWMGLGVADVDKATQKVRKGLPIQRAPITRMGRFAASPMALNALKVGTGLGAVGSVLGAADILTGDDSLGNKAMDVAGMGIGGFLGMAGGPMGAAAGAGLGKAASDGIQALFGSRPTLNSLQGGNY